MKGICLALSLSIIVITTACTNSKPHVQAMMMTEPWTSMKLPCSGDALVVNSDEKVLTCAYSGRGNREGALKTIAPYVEILKQNGWKITEDLPDTAVQYQFEKGNEALFLHLTTPAVLVNGEVRKWRGFGIQAEIWTKN